jgi:hypothetical protein
MAGSRGYTVRVHHHRRRPPGSFRRRHVSAAQYDGDHIVNHSDLVSYLPKIIFVNHSNRAGLQSCNWDLYRLSVPVMVGRVSCFDHDLVFFFHFRDVEVFRFVPDCF